MKILYIVNIPSPYRVEYFNELGKFCDLTVVFERAESTERDESWKHTDFANFKGIICQGKSTGVDSAFTKEPVKFIRKNRYDFIIVGNAMSLSGLYEIAYLKRKKIPYWIEGDGAFCPNGENRIKYILKKYLLQGATGYFSTCKNHDLYYEHYGVEKKDIYRYPFSSVKKEDILEKPLTREEKETLREQLNIKEEKVVVSAGQFIYRKGFDVLLKAAKLLPKDVGFYLIGGKKPEDIEELSNVHYVNFVPKKELFQYFDAADCFVCPTREDIWGLVINEAMARGLPVITTDRCNAGLELVQDGSNGYIVPNEQAEKMAEKIAKVLEENALLSMEKNALKRAENYTIEKMAKAHMDLWNQRDKKILFIGYGVNKEIVSTLSGSSVAGNKMQLNVLDSMKKYVKEIHSITIYPLATFPREKKVHIKSDKIDLGIGLESVRVGFWNLPLIKQTSQIVAVYRAAKKYIKKNRDAVIFTFNMYPQVGVPAMKLQKKYGCKVVPLLADLPIDDDYARKGISGILRKIFDGQTKKSILKADKLIVLNKNARDLFAPNTEYCVVEGGINPQEFETLKKDSQSPMTKGNKEQENGEKNIVYGGSLQEYSGIKQLAECMELLEDDRVVLDIYGDGALREYLEKYPSEKVRYHGKVTNQEMLKIQQNAWLLVNPRPVDDAIAQVTFPSKMFEYLMSGVPVLATRLNGFLPEYEDKLFLAENNSKEELAEKINKIAKMNNEELKTMAKSARDFLLSSKTWDIQVEKMVQFMFR